MKVEGKYLYYGEDMSDVFSIRDQVLQAEKSVIYDTNSENLEKESIHVVTRVDDKAVATGSIYMKDDYFIISLIAVIEEYRYKKLGDFTLRMLIDKSFIMGAKKIKILTPIKYQGFYEKVGFLVDHKNSESHKEESRIMILQKDSLCKCCKG